jgi:hypothetical protein
VTSQLAKLGKLRSFAGGLICPGSPVAVRSSIAADSPPTLDAERPKWRAIERSERCMLSQ